MRTHARLPVLRLALCATLLLLLCAPVHPQGHKSKRRTYAARCLLSLYLCAKKCRSYHVWNLRLI